MVLLLIACSTEAVNPIKREINQDACLFAVAVKHCENVEYGVKILKIFDHKKVIVKCADFSPQVTLTCKEYK